MNQSPEQLHRAFEDAFNRHDLDAIVDLYELDAVLASPSGTVRGIDAIREQYRRALATRPSIVVQTLSVHVTGELALLHGEWTLRETGVDGRQRERSGRNAETARQQSDGR